jgi:hypothetical protein
MNKPTHRAFGTRGATDIVSTMAIAPLLRPTLLKVPRLPRDSSIGLIIKCAVALWVIAILCAVFWARGDAFL